MKTRSGTLFGHEDKSLLLEKLQLQLHKTALSLDGVRAMRSTMRFEEVARTQHLTYDTEADRFLAAQAEGLRELQAGVERLLAADTSHDIPSASSPNTSGVASEDEATTVPTLPKLRRHRKQSKKIAPTEKKTSPTKKEDFQPDRRELLALKAEIVTIKEEHEPEAEPTQSLKKPVTHANAAEKVRTIAPHRTTGAPTDGSVVGSRSDELRGQDSVVDLIKQLKLRVIAVEKDHCDPMWGTATMIITPEVIQEMSDAVTAVVDKLHGVEMTMNAARPLLDLLGAFRQIRHPFLTEILVSPINILQTLMYRLPNSIAGMEQVDKPHASDTSAMDCFTVALDLLTTLDDRRRMELVHQAMISLRRDFEPRVVLRKSTHEKFKRLRKHDTKLNVTWAGRLLLACAHVIAHVIAVQGQTHLDDFLDILQGVGSRHGMFPGLLQRCHTIVTKPPSPTISIGDAPIRCGRFKLKHEAKRIREICARFTDE